MKKRPKTYRNIYKNNNRYYIVKQINNKVHRFGSYDTLHEAILVKKELIANNWKPLKKTQEQQREEEIKDYYKYLYTNEYRRQIHVTNKKGRYLGGFKDIRDALYYRDQYIDKDHTECPKPETLNLKLNNPYREHGLKYPVPERLQLTNKEKYTSQGSIFKKGPNSYHIHRRKYICACTTYEQAYYVKKELQKCDWDTTQLPRIHEEYPLWYTRLLEFYRYVQPRTQKYKTGRINKGWLISVPVEYRQTENELLIGYNNVEDALYERDFLMEHDWDYELLVYTIDDNENPYYDMELPPYPERKIRNIRILDTHEKELRQIKELLEEGLQTQYDISKKLGVTELTIRHWFKKWGTSWTEFKKLVQIGEDPFTILEKPVKIYQPDLSKNPPPNFNNYVSVNSKSSRSPWRIMKNGIDYGSYYTEEQAQKVASKLKKCGWDKSKLPEIRASVGWEPLTTRGNVYPQGKHGWMIRKKNKQRRMINYGFYKDKRIAEAVRDLLILHNWDKKEYPRLRKLAEQTISVLRLLESNMFTGTYNTDYLENLCAFEELSNQSDTINMQYITYNKDRDKYFINKTINGQLSNYGQYDNKNEAIFARELLLENNWDKEVLNLVKEIF